MKNISLIYIILISKSFATKDYFVIQNSYILFRENQENVKSIKIHSLGLALWSSEEYALQYRVRGFNPWSGNRDPTCHGTNKSGRCQINKELIKKNKKQKNPQLLASIKKKKKSWRYAPLLPRVNTFICHTLYPSLTSLTCNL